MTQEWPDMLVAGAQRVVRVSDGGNSIETFHEGFGQYYGITWSNDAVYLVGRGHMPDDEDRIGAESLIGISAVGQRIVLRGKWQAHQAYYMPAYDVVCVCAPEREAVVMYNPASGAHHPWVLSSCDADRHHYNSLWSNEHIWLVAHRWGRSFVHEFDDKLVLKRTHKIGRRAHNVYVQGPLIYMLSSDEHRMVAVRKGTRRIIKQNSSWGNALKPEDCWLRGLCRTRDAFYVGISRTSDRAGRCEGSSWVAKLDEDLKLQDLLEIPGTGQIGDIRVTTGIDYAHNRLPFPSIGLESLESEPAAAMTPGA